MDKTHPNFNIEPKKRAKSNWMKGFVLEPKRTEAEIMDHSIKGRGKDTLNKKAWSNI